MKKILPLILISCFCCILCSCGNSSDALTKKDLEDHKKEISLLLDNKIDDLRKEIEAQSISNKLDESMKKITESVDKKISSLKKDLYSTKNQVIDKGKEVIEDIQDELSNLKEKVSQ